MAQELDCIICKKQGTGDISIQCDKCDSYTHVPCAKLTPILVERIINFFCDNCHDKQHIITWDGQKLNKAQRTARKGGYYDVKAIKNHRRTRVLS